MFNSSNRVLDVMCCNSSCQINKSIDPLLEEDQYHTALEVEVKQSHRHKIKNIFFYPL